MLELFSCCFTIVPYKEDVYVVRQLNSSTILPMSLPTFLYKIIPSSSPLPSPLPDILPSSDLDKKDGFIHLSTAKQILGTLKLIFKDDTKVYILKIWYEKVEKDVKWEEGSCVPGALEGEEKS